MINPLIKTDLQYRPAVLLILDGWGHRLEKKNNAVLLAKTPFLDMCIDNYPWCLLTCSGEAVGLPEGYMGNSEVGHLNIGAGRVVYQEFTRINKSIKDGDFFKNKILLQTFEEAIKNNKKVHLLGLLSDGGVHSHISHFEAVIKYAASIGFKNLVVHPIFDGRDTAPMEGDKHLETLFSYFATYGVGSIGSMSGRYYAMDRDNRWDRVERAYDAFTLGDIVNDSDPITYVKNSHSNDIGDEFIEPVCNNKENLIKDGDSIIFMNFRADRARQISRAFFEKAFTGFKRKKELKLNKYVCLTEYDETFPVLVLFPPVKLENILGEVISNTGLRQLRIAETEKYAHVTFFFNGGEEKKFKRETRVLIDSPREVATYDLKPEMSANEVSEKLLENIHKRIYDFVVVNYANCDMVGHTGKLAAAIKAVETVDAQVKEIVEAVIKNDGVLFITADHGNAEYMATEDGTPFTAHTTNPVKFIIVTKDLYKQQLEFKETEKVLADIAPTILEFMGIKKPIEMTGVSVVKYFWFDTKNINKLTNVTKEK